MYVRTTWLCKYWVFSHSKPCLIWPLKNRQKFSLNDKWLLFEGQKYCRIALSDILSWSCPQDRFYSIYFVFWRKMQLIVISSVSWELIFALWKTLKPFSTTGLRPWPHTGGVSPDPFKSAYSIKCPRNGPVKSVPERFCQQMTIKTWKITQACTVLYSSWNIAWHITQLSSVIYLDLIGKNVLIPSENMILYIIIIGDSYCFIPILLSHHISS